MKKHKNIPIFVPHNGCPNDCSFCNQKKITGVSHEVTPLEADKIIADALKHSNGAEVEIAFFGGSFTGIRKDYRNSLLSVAEKYVKRGEAVGIRLSTRPDYIDDEILSELKSFGVTDIELGVQTMADDVLKKNRRGHTAQQAEIASKKIKEYGFKLGLQMMPGLFGDTVEKTVYTAEKIASLMPYCVRIYPTLVIKDTYLEQLYRQGEFVPLSVNEAVEICTQLVPIFEDRDIKIIRMGLMATDTVAMGADVVAGPFHPSFGELVESKILLNKAIKELGGKKGNAEFFVNPKTVSAFVGNKKSNIIVLSKTLGGSVKVTQNENLARGEVRAVVS